MWLRSYFRFFNKSPYTVTWRYDCTAGISSHFQKLEDILRSQFIPAINGTPAPDDLDRQLFALPAREGGLGITNPASLCEHEYSASKAISGPHSKAVLHCSGYSYSCLADQLAAKSEFRQQKQLQNK